MKSVSKTLLLLSLVGLSFVPAQAARLSDDGSGQALILPLFVAGIGLETTITVRNNDLILTKAVRVVVKDPVNGRPTLSMNVYLEPGDSWFGTLKDVNPDTRLFQNALGTLAPWTDASCTIPRLESVPAEGLVLSDQFLDESFGNSVFLPNRRAQGYIEIYEMGRIPTAALPDCDTISANFEDAFGIWNTGDDLANFGVSPPGRGLEASAVIIDTRDGIAYQFEALAIADFSDRALHTHPSQVRVPSLADVSPAESKRLVDGEIVATDWSNNPIGAIDALIMTSKARADIVSSQALSATAFVVFAMPTAPFHNDAEGFYLGGSTRMSAPFSEDASLGAGLDSEGPPLDIMVRDVDGNTLPLDPTGEVNRCEQLLGAQMSVELTNSVAFVGRCQVSDAEFRVPNAATRGDVTVRFDGQLTAADGTVLSGLPVHGVLLQSFRDDDDPKFGWAQPLKSR